MIPFCEFTDACRHVAAQIEDSEIGAEKGNLLRASHAARADPCALFQSVEATGLFSKQDITDRSSFQSRGEPEARIEHRRHILEAVHRDIDRSIVQRLL